MANRLQTEKKKKKKNNTYKDGGASKIYREKTAVFFLKNMFFKTIIKDQIKTMFPKEHLKTK